MLQYKLTPAWRGSRPSNQPTGATFIIPNSKRAEFRGCRIQGREETQVLDIGGNGWPDWALSAEGICFSNFSKVTPPDDSVSLKFRYRQNSSRMDFGERTRVWGIARLKQRESRLCFYAVDEFAESNLMMVGRTLGNAISVSRGRRRSITAQLPGRMTRSRIEEKPKPLRS